MNKSKSWIKSLLIVVLALLMVFSLVACNPGVDDDDNNDNNQPVTTNITPTDYFTQLWDLTAKIGDTKIEANDTIAIDLGMEIALNMRDVMAPSMPVVSTVDLGVELQAVVGRTNDTSKETALKVSLYDPTNTAARNILSLYLFANDLDNLYVDFGGYNIKVPNTVATTIWNEILGNETELGDQVANGLNNQFIDINGTKMSINQLLQQFVGEFDEENWNLNTLVNGLLDMFNFDIDTIFDSLGSFKDIVTGMLGVSSAEDLKDSNGNIDLMKLLTGKVVGTLFTNNKKITKGNVSEYRTVLDQATLETAAGMFGFNGLFSTNNKSYNEVALGYTEESGEIKDFTISARLGGLVTRITTSDNALHNSVPELAIKINNLSIEKVAETNKVAIDKTKYTDEVAVNEKFAVELKGVNYAETDLSCKIEVGVIGRVDVVNEKNNKTNLNIIVDFTDAQGQKATLARASFNNGIIAAALTEPITVEGKQFKGVRFDVSDRFNIAAEFKNGVKELVYMIAPSLKPTDKAATAAEGGFDLAAIKAQIEGVVSVVKAVFSNAMSMVYADNNLVIDTENIAVQGHNNILGVVVAIVNSANYGNDEWTDWTIENRNEAIINSLTNPPLPGKTVPECLEIILAQFGMSGDDNGNGEGAATIDWQVITNALLQIAYNVAHDIRIDGVSDKDFTKDEIKTLTNAETVSDETLKAWNDDKIYIRHILAVLGAQIKFVGDVQNGVHATLTAKVADATLTITESLEMVKVETDTFFDVNDEYEADVKDEKDALWYTQLPTKDEKPQQ